LVLASFDGDEARFAERLDTLFISGEIGEHMALFRGLPLYPVPERLIARAAEGIRSAVQPVFEAVAHANPYPYERFSETQWNHMVLKALFIGSTLDPIQGLDQRRNADPLLDARPSTHKTDAPHLERVRHFGTIDASGERGQAAMRSAPDLRQEVFHPFVDL
jgi:hypothetical protein